MRTLLVLGLGAAIGAAVYFLAGARGKPVAPHSESAEQRVLAAFRDRAGDVSLGQLFDELNARHFNGQLPGVKVIWAPDLDRLDIGDYRLNGMADGRIILLDAELQDDDANVRRILCHEMVHVRFITAGRTLTNHDVSFQNELRRIFDDGCFQAIPASPGEKASLKVWVDSARARLDAVRSQIDLEGAAIKREAAEIEALFTALNERIEIANAAGTGWPARDETEAAERRRTVLNDRIVTLNSTIAANETDQRAFNEAVQRYNLILAYPDGLAEDRAKGLVR